MGTMKKVLVTGAGGFVGGWVVESFLLAGIPVRAGLRSWNSAVRLARHRVEMVPCDVLIPTQLDVALKDCDAVVHCAVGSEQVTVTGTRNVMSAACRHDIQRIVHLSSVAVYGKSPGTIVEDHPRHSRGNPYAQYKIEAETVCEEFMDQGLPIRVLRPSIIYGPFSEAWTVSFGKRLTSGKWGTFGKSGEGLCNLVYVTDVVQAIYRALHADEQVSGFFNVNGVEPITWNEYFTRFNDALQGPPLRQINPLPIALKARLFAPVRSTAKFALSRFGKSITALHAKSALAASYMSATESTLKLTPTREQLKLYAVRANYPIDKAHEQLGFWPQVDVNQGLSRSVAWLRQHGIVESRS